MKKNKTTKKRRKAGIRKDREIGIAAPFESPDIAFMRTQFDVDGEA
jgi:hypothetical protein